MVGDLVAGKGWRGEQAVEGVPGNEGHLDDGVILGSVVVRLWDSARRTCVVLAGREDGKLTCLPFRTRLC